MTKLILTFRNFAKAPKNSGWVAKLVGDMKDLPGARSFFIRPQSLSWLRRDLEFSLSCLRRRHGIPSWDSQIPSTFISFKSGWVIFQVITAALLKTQVSWDVTLRVIILLHACRSARLTTEQLIPENSNFYIQICGLILSLTDNSNELGSLSGG